MILPVDLCPAVCEPPTGCGCDLTCAAAPGGPGGLGVRGGERRRPPGALERWHPGATSSATDRRAGMRGRLRACELGRLPRERQRSGHVPRTHEPGLPLPIARRPTHAWPPALPRVGRCRRVLPGERRPRHAALARSRPVSRRHGRPASRDRRRSAAEAGCADRRRQASRSRLADR